MRKKKYKTVTSLRPYVNFDFILPGFGDNERYIDDDIEDEIVDPGVRAMARRIEKEGFDAVLDDIKKSFIKELERWKTENAAEGDLSKSPGDHSQLPRID